MNTRWLWLGIKCNGSQNIPLFLSEKSIHFWYSTEIVSGNETKEKVTEKRMCIILLTTPKCVWAHVFQLVVGLPFFTLFLFSSFFLPSDRFDICVWQMFSFAKSTQKQAGWNNVKISAVCVCVCVCLMAICLHACVLQLEYIQPTNAGQVNEFWKCSFSSCICRKNEDEDPQTYHNAEYTEKLLRKLLPVCVRVCAFFAQAVLASMAWFDICTEAVYCI